MEGFYMNEANSNSDEQTGFKGLQFLYFSQATLFLFTVAFVLISISHFYYKNYQDSGGVFTKTRKVLIVIAHPDDECMFFGPTILHFTRKAGVEIHLMCLSEGNFYGDGQTRSQELRASCQELGIPLSNIQLISDDHLPDDPSIDWDTELISSYISVYVKTEEVDTVLTFDDYGVSGHRNHTAIFSAVQSMIAENKLPVCCKCFALKSENIFVKYMGFLTVLLRRSNSNVFISSYGDHRIIKCAMSRHASQYVWFRKFFTSISSYCYLNAFVCLKG